MDKKVVKKHLIDVFNRQLEELKESAKNSRSYANNSDMKPDGKYDTRATEAKYLADAMAKKLDDITLDLKMLEEVPDNDFAKNDPLRIGSLVYLEHNQIKNWYYLSPVAGGHILNINETGVLVISVFSPLGSELVGLNKGDDVFIETPKGDKSYLIIDCL